eukprot:323027_1
MQMNYHMLEWEFSTAIYCIITILIDVVFVIIIFNAHQTDKYKMQSQQINNINSIKSRWWVITIRLEKSPFCLLSIYKFICSTLTFALFFVYNINFAVSYTMEITNNMGYRDIEDIDPTCKDPVCKGMIWSLQIVCFLIIFFQRFILYGILMTLHSVLMYYIIKITFHCCMLTWYNYGDTCSLFNIGGANCMAAHIWRACHFLCSCIFAWNEVSSQRVFSRFVYFNINTNYLFQVFCRWMIIEGTIWALVYFGSCIYIALRIPLSETDQHWEPWVHRWLKKKGLWTQRINWFVDSLLFLGVFFAVISLMKVNF